MEDRDFYVEVSVEFLKYITSVINGKTRPPKGKKFVATYCDVGRNGPYVTVRAEDMTPLEELIESTKDGL